MESSKEAIVRGRGHAPAREKRSRAQAAARAKADITVKTLKTIDTARQPDALASSVMPDRTRIAATAA
jgi:hypothetical protein